MSFPTTPSRSNSASPECYEIDDDDDDVIIMGEEVNNSASHSFYHEADMSLPPSPPVTFMPMPVPNNVENVWDTDPRVVGRWPGSPVSQMSRDESPAVWEVFRDESIVDAHRADTDIEELFEDPAQSMREESRNEYEVPLKQTPIIPESTSGTSQNTNAQPVERAGINVEEVTHPSEVEAGFSEVNARFDRLLVRIPSSSSKTAF